MTRKSPIRDVPSRRGSIVLLFLLTMVGIVLPAIGLAVDGGSLLLIQTKLSGAVDAAALAGANSHSSSIATNYFNANFPSKWMGTTVPTGQPTISVSGSTATVTATVTAPLYFLRMAGFSSTSIAAAATASPLGSTDCSYSTNTSNSRTFQADATINMGCGLSVATTADDGLHEEGSGTLTASAITINSQDTPNYNYGSITPTPTTAASSSFSDPLASVSLPSYTSPYSSCTGTSTSIVASTTLSPGRYCGGITISNGANVTLKPGLYVITGGINWNSSGTKVTGTGVTLFFTKGGSDSYGNVTISGGVTVNLSAPTDAASLSDGVSGIVMAADRSWKDTSQVINFNGGSDTTLQGEIYAPGVGLIISAATVTGSKYAGIVADNIDVNGGGTLTLPTPDYSSLNAGNPFTGSGPAYLTK